MSVGLPAQGPEHQNAAQHAVPKTAAPDYNRYIRAENVMHPLTLLCSRLSNEVDEGLGRQVHTLGVLRKLADRRC